VLQINYGALNADWLRAACPCRSVISGSERLHSFVSFVNSGGGFWGIVDWNLFHVSVDLDNVLFAIDGRFAFFRIQRIAEFHVLFTGRRRMKVSEVSNGNDNYHGCSNEHHQRTYQQDNGCDGQGTIVVAGRSHTGTTLTHIASVTVSFSSVVTTVVTLCMRTETAFAFNTTVGILLETIRAEHKTLESRTCFTFARVTPIGIFFESILAVHSANRWGTRVALACRTTIRVVLESVWTVHRTGHRRACFTLTCVTTVGILLESIRAVHKALGSRTCFTFARVTPIGIFLESILAEHSASHW
jgi:hypothetical protein